MNTFVENNKKKSAILLHLRSTLAPKNKTNSNNSCAYKGLSFYTESVPQMQNICQRNKSKRPSSDNRSTFPCSVGTLWVMSKDQGKWTEREGFVLLPSKIHKMQAITAISCGMKKKSHLDIVQSSDGLVRPGRRFPEHDWKWQHASHTKPVWGEKIKRFKGSLFL